MSFLPMSLSSFTSKFGFDENDATLNLKKGYFPHFFNTSANQTYHGDLPDRHFYGPDTMSNDRYRDFDQWYTEKLQQETTDSIFGMKCLSTVNRTFSCFGQGLKSFTASFKSWTTLTLFNTPPLLRPVREIFASPDWKGKPLLRNRWQAGDVTLIIRWQPSNGWNYKEKVWVVPSNTSAMKVNIVSVTGIVRTM